MSRTGNDASGFTLLELLVTVAIVALGMVLIYEALFMSLDTLALASERFQAVEWSNDKMWEAQDRLNQYGFLTQEADGGEILVNQKALHWTSRVRPLTETLYQVDLRMTWKTGSRDMVFRRASWHIAKMNPEAP